MGIGGGLLGVFFVDQLGWRVCLSVLSKASGYL